MSGIEDWEPVPASNNAAPPVGAPEDHDRSDVNDIAREMMASTRADWEGSATGGGEWRNLIKGETLLFVSGTVVDVVGVDVTTFFPAGRKIRVLHSSGSDAYCFVASSAFTTNTRITVGNFDSAGASEIGAAVNRLQIHNAFGGGFGIDSGAFEPAGGSLFEIPTALTAAGINAAITAASSAGKIVLLDDATYNLEAAVVIQSGVSIYGRGMRGSSTLKVQYDGYAITSGAFVTSFALRDFSIDGDSAARAAGGGISIGDRNSGVTIENVYVTDVWEYGVTTLSPFISSVGTVIRNVEVNGSGDHCFYITDPLGLSTRIYCSGLIASDPGGVGKASASAACLWIEGQVTLSDIAAFVGSGPVGIRLEQVGVAGSPLGANATVLNGFRITSTGTSSTGLFVGGRENVISNGHVETTGASANPLVVDGRGGSPEQALDNHISGVRFEDGLSCTIAGDALRTEIHDCIFSAQSSVGLAISGNDTLVKGCTVIGGQATGIQITGGASGVEVTNCTIRDTVGDAIDVQAGTSGSYVLYNIPAPVGFNSVYITGVAQPNYGTVKIPLTDMSGIVFPAGGSDGNKRFLLEAVGVVVGGGASDLNTFRLHVGASGDETDAVESSGEVTITSAVTAAANIERHIVTPSAGDTVTFSVEATAVATNDILASAATSFDAKAYTYLSIAYLDG